MDVSSKIVILISWFIGFLAYSWVSWAIKTKRLKTQAKNDRLRREAEASFKKDMERNLAMQRKLSVIYNAISSKQLMNEINRDISKYTRRSEKDITPKTKLLN